MTKKQLIFFVLFNLLLSIGFYIDNKSALYTDISSDSANIIPICLKKDNPELFKSDLYLDQLEDVEYYTPFYVDTLRFLAKFTLGNYLQAQSILGFFVHFIHGILWFLLFYNIKKDYWIALLMMLFAKGVIWPPGGELIGITELWTMMPRTVYTALLPLPFLLYKNLKKYNLVIAALILGLIVNFHPLSGIGGIIGYGALYISSLYFNDQIDKTIFRKLLTILLFTLIGMFPYLYVYLTKVNPELVSNPALFEEAFNRRIPSLFSNPIEFVKKWNRSIFYFYLGAFLMLFFIDKSKNKITFKTLLVVVVTLFLTANLSVYIEKLFNGFFNLSIRMSFQLIRFQKFILVVFQISLFLVLTNVLSKLKVNDLKKAGIFISFYVILMFADSFPLNKLPLIGDDICTTTLPMSLKFREKEVPKNKKDFNEMLTYIKLNTPQNAVFYGSFYIRSACQRSVVLDGKGASMVIEGNPEKLSQWHLDITSLNSMNQYERLDFLKSKKVTHILSQNNEWDFLTPIKIIGTSRLYQIQ
jgi:hypothetical protein